MHERGPEGDEVCRKCVSLYLDLEEGRMREKGR